MGGTTWDKNNPFQDFPKLEMPAMCQIEDGNEVSVKLFTRLGFKPAIDKREQQLAAWITP